MNLGASDIGFRNTVYSFAHCPVVVAGRHDEIDLFYLTILVNPVIVDQSTAGCFDNTDTLGFWITTGIENILAEDVGVIEENFNIFSCVKGFNQAGCVIVQGVLNRFPVIEGFKFFQFFVG